MAKAHAPPPVVVIGDHPSGHFAAALLRQGYKGSVLHCALPGEENPDRLVVINPEFFDLHKSLGSLKRKLHLAPIYGLKFLSDDPALRSEHAAKTIVGYIGSFGEVHKHLRKLAQADRVEQRTPQDLAVTCVDERGVVVRIDGKEVHAAAVVLASGLPPAQRKALGLPEEWDSGVLHRYTFVKLQGEHWHPRSAKPLMPMSLDLAGKLDWAWLLPGKTGVQLAISQTADSINERPPLRGLRRWAEVLVRHGELTAMPSDAELAKAQCVELPLAGALAQEGVANRTLLVGPAGGFVSACAEEIYPTCWSAVFAAEVLKKALKERFIQDALQPYRQRWGSTLGDYLRGPQQNLRFLLPLVYRNPVMTTRLTDAILLGRSVVR